MRIEIEIPKEFEEHFKQDKFKDSLERIMADIKHSLENGDCLCAGRYEYETIEMLEKSFENSRKAYNIDKVVEKIETYGKNTDVCISKKNAIEIVKQEAEKFGTDINVVSNGWIPCSERLPEESGYYLVTYHYWSDGNFLPKYDDTYVRRLHYQISKHFVGWNYPKNVDDRAENDCHKEVIAWQPLPEPFKERD